MRFDGIRGTTYDFARRFVVMVGKTFAHYVVLEEAAASAGMLSAAAV